MRGTRTAALAVGCGLGAWAAFGLLTAVVVGHDGRPLPVDRALLSWSVGHRPDVAVAFARGLTATGTGVVPYVLAVLAGIVAGRTPRRRALAVALCLGCLGAGQALRYGVMTLVARPRPPLMDWQTHASGWAFPSGHTTTSALTAGLLIIALRVRGARGGVPFTVAVGAWAAAVGLTRVYLGVHWFTDVVGGWLFAVGWLGVFLYAAVRGAGAEPFRGVTATDGDTGSGPTGPTGPAGPAGTTECRTAATAQVRTTARAQHRTAATAQRTAAIAARHPATGTGPAVGVIPP
ncbi:phosphatase PAP2 family protein [Streptomyces asoensis]|uniref:phosphatase PAP2 family protein n=1 Tax=Streptomyces asoensis TaxID=249586 RepID=UPI0033C823E1